VRLPKLTRPIDPSSQTWESERVANIIRVLVLVLCLCLTAISPDRHKTLPWFPLLIAAATIGSVRQHPRLAGRIGRIVEAVVCAVAVIGSNVPTSPLFPYLIAPSFAGGLLAGLLTEVPGSSGMVERGFVTYSNAAKTELLGVPEELIDRHHSDFHY